MPRAVRLLASLTALFACAVAHAQLQNVGTIRGIVKDPSVGVIVGASVVATNQATGVETSAISNEAGAYTIANLAIGLYNLEVSFKGFRTVRKTDLHLVSGLILTQDIDLPLGETTQVVSVEASQQIIETASGSMGNTRTLEEIKDLPLSIGGSRNSIAYLVTLPGFNPATNIPQTISRGTHLGVGGSNAFASSVVGYNIDGISAATNMTPSLEDLGPLVPEMVEEIRYATNPNSESGGNLGASLSMVTKSGTNHYHGTVWENWRNNVLDARSFQSATRSPNNQNEYGFVLGGPILKDKMFFIGSWDGYKLRRAPSPSTGTVPTGLMREGNFSEWLGAQVGTDVLGRPVVQGAIYDPQTVRTANGAFVRDMFPGNIIPRARLSPISTALAAKAFPIATRPGTQLNWTGTTYRSGVDLDKLAFKLDNNFWRNHRLSGGFDMLPDHHQLPQPFTPITGKSSESDLHQAIYRGRINESWTARPNLVLSLRVGYNRYKFLNDITPDAANIGCDIGFKGTFSCAAPFTHIETMPDVGYFWPRFYRFFTEVPVNLDASLHKGKHEVGFGSEFSQQRGGIIAGDRASGEFTFNSRGTGQPGFANTGVGYASYLLGDVDSGTLANYLANTYTARYFGLFVQDQWRITSKLTINYGLRWDYSQPLSEVHNRIGSFDPSRPNPAAGGRLGALSFWGDGSGRNGRRYLYDTYWKAFGPRVGLAYAFNPKTVMRASYGLNYATTLSDFIGGDSNIPAYGWTARVSRSSLDLGVTPAFNWNNGFPSGIFPVVPNPDPSSLNGSGVQFFNPSDSKPARSQNIGFALERELPGNLLVKGEYVAKLTHGLLSFGYYSPPLNELDPKYLSLGNLLGAQVPSAAAQAAGIAPPYPGFTGTVAQALRPYPQYTGVSMPGSRSMFSLYNGVLLTAQKRLGRGLFFLVGYTISKHFERSGTIQCLCLLGASKTLMSYDHPQVLAISYSYDLPFGPGKRFLPSNHPVVKHLVGGWQVTGVHQRITGSPIAIATRGVIGPGFGNQWAISNPNVPIRTKSGCSDFDSAYPSAPYSYLNLGAFGLPPSFTFGDTRILPSTRDCATWNENLSLIKNIAAREGIQARLGVAFFNTFNRHYWSGLQTDINNPSVFGRFTSASGPRNGQLWLKVEF